MALEFGANSKKIMAPGPTVERLLEKITSRFSGASFQKRLAVSAASIGPKDFTS